MKILAISDIHGQFEHMPVASLPDADLCIFAGDLTNTGLRSPRECIDGLTWLEQLGRKFPRVMWIPGNHDIGFTKKSLQTSNNVTWIEGAKRFHGGLTFYGIALSTCYNMPSLADEWDYMTATETVERKAFGKIPPDADVIVSHSPPFGCQDGEGFGSLALREHILTHNPKLVICGHIHEAAGINRLGETVIVNTARAHTLLDMEALERHRFDVFETASAK